MIPASLDVSVTSPSSFSHIFSDLQVDWLRNFVLVFLISKTDFTGELMGNSAEGSQGNRILLL